MPASYRYYQGTRGTKRRVVGDPSLDVAQFLKEELSLGVLCEMLPHLWFAGWRRPATQLHLQVAMGRQLVVADRMDLHLLWDKNGRVFLKPIPAFIFNQDFWRDHLKCPAACACQDPPPASCKTELRSIAFGFLYTYICLISSETDFFVASEARLLPRKTDGSAILWAEWKQWAREFLNQKNNSSIKVHPRFLRAELRLSRVNTIHRLTHFPLLTPYLRGRNTYGSLFSDNIAWLATAAVFIALVLTAMQLGLATDQLKGDAAFQQASYGFAIFAILVPIWMFGLVILRALFQLCKDLPSLLGNLIKRRRTSPVHV